MDHIADCFLLGLIHRMLDEVVSVVVGVSVCPAPCVRGNFPPLTFGLLCFLLYHRWRERSNSICLWGGGFLGQAFLKVYGILVPYGHVVVFMGTSNAGCWSIWWVCRGSLAFGVLCGSGGVSHGVEVWCGNIGRGRGVLYCRCVACLHCLEKSLKDFLLLYEDEIAVCILRELTLLFQFLVYPYLFFFF